MKRSSRTVRSLVLVALSLTAACGEDDIGPEPPGEHGSGGSGGSAGSVTGGSAGKASGGSAGNVTGGSAGSPNGGSAGSNGGSSGSGGSGGDMLCDYGGGAIVVFEIVAETLRVGTVNGAFIAEAERLLDAGETRVPVFASLVDGTDCDPQWSWHPDPSDMEFADFTIELCDGLPSYIEENKAEWMSSVVSYCPWSARVTEVIRLEPR